VKLTELTQKLYERALAERVRDARVER
jgi:hypothetical protein